jgi:hypothetical protein
VTEITLRPVVAPGARRKLPSAVLPSCAMTENAADTCPLLPLEQVAQAVRELGAERTLEGFAARFLESVRRWAAPSAVLAAVRDPAAEGGWRLLPALCTGSGPLGAERAVRQLVEELPQDLTTARLVRPVHEIPGAKMRPNCLVPWTWERESGVLMLRGVSGGAPGNLAEAIALLSAPAWARVLGGPAERVESSVAELGRLAERLRAEADRQVERLQAARTPAAPEPPAPDPDATARMAELEQQLTTAKAEIDRLSALDDAHRAEGTLERLGEAHRAAAEAKADARAARESLAEAQKAAAEARAEASAARAEAGAAKAEIGAATAEATAARAEATAAKAEAAAAREGLAEAEKAAADARAEARAAKEGLAEAREAEVKLKAVAEQLQAEKAASAWRREEERAVVETTEEKARAAAKAAEESLAATRKELEEAEASVARLIVEREELRQQVSTLEKALGETEEERDEFHRESTRLEKRLHALGVARPPAAGEAGGESADPKPFSTETVEAFRRALAVMRRTPFLPPPLRVAAEEAEAAAGSTSERKEAWARVVILDRDTPALEPLAGQLEAAGLDVKMASHPEEIALLLKTPEGRELDGAICDVLAFRPDQNVAGIFRAWEKDRAGLALYISFSRDSAPEVERAQRVPHSLTKGRFQRPLDWTELMSMLQPLRHVPS